MKRIAQSADGKEFAKYIVGKIRELDTCDVGELQDDRHIALLIKARSLAANMLKDILNDFVEASAETPELNRPDEYVV